MTTIDISIPEDMRAFIETQMACGRVLPLPENIYIL